MIREYRRCTEKMAVSCELRVCHATKRRIISISERKPSGFDSKIRKGLRNERDFKQCTGCRNR